MAASKNNDAARVVPIRQGRHSSAVRGLLPTKITPPRLRSRTVERLRLIESLDRLTTHPLTLVLGPAGAGKSTLLTQWLATQHRDAVWLGLDAGDNHPSRFVAYILAALAQVEPSLGADIESVLNSPIGPGSKPTQHGAEPDSHLETMLAEQLIIPLVGRESPLVLVIDDYHVITAEPIHAAMQWLIENLPHCLYLVLASRTEPPLGLARLHARALLGQLNAHELCFRAHEAAIFYNQVMHLDLDDEDIARIEARTEGWPAGSQLAALSLRSLHLTATSSISATLSDSTSTPSVASTQPATSTQIPVPSGRDRMIATYLLEEVWAQQSSERQGFVLQTAILDRMTAPLATALSGLDSAEVETHLVALERDNLFVIRLDATWIRYHHLFRDFLRTRLAQQPSEHLRALHRRASQWLADCGLRQEAVDHALASADVDWIATLFERWVALLIVDNDVGTVLHWLSQVPDSVRQQRAIFDFAAGWCDILVGYLKRGVAAISNANAQSQQDGTPAQVSFGINAMGNILTIAAWLRQGNHARALVEADKTLSMLPSESSSLRAGYYHMRGLCLLEAGDLDAALASLTEAEAGFGQDRDYIVICLACQAQVHRLAGRPDAAARTARRALAAAEKACAETRSGAGYARVELGWLALQAGDLATAKDHVEAGLSRMRLLRDVAYIQHGTELLARVKHAHGNIDEAIDVIDESLIILEGTDMLPSIARMQSLRAEMAAKMTTQMNALPRLNDSATSNTVTPHNAAKSSPPCLHEPLTERERQVLAHAAQGASNREIAAALFVSIGTIKTHMHRVLAKLHADNRTHAVHRARELGIPGIP